jgi:hypothetical protein
MNVPEKHIQTFISTNYASHRIDIKVRSVTGQMQADITVVEGPVTPCV